MRRALRLRQRLALLAVDGPYGLSVAGALCLGLAAGVPFALLFAAAQRTRPDAPGAAAALVNAFAVLAILVGTPLAGLASELPGDGALAFGAIAALAALALLAVRAAPLARDNRPVAQPRERETWL